MVRRKTRKHRGGKYLAEGTYGCVFGKRPLKCTEEGDRRTNKYISKLTTQRTADEELERIAFLRSIDHNEDNLILPINSCKLNRDSVGPENQIQKCSKYKEYDTLLFSKYGGKSIHNLKLPYDEYIPFFNSLVSLFEVIEKLHNANYAHCDIKCANILIQKQPDNTFKTRLIDFDLLTKDNDLFTNQDTREMFNTVSYIAWPFELKLASNDNLPHTESFLESNLSFWYLEQLKYGGYASLPGYSYFGPGLNKRFKGTSPEIQALKTIDYFKYSLSKVDIFSLGVVLSQVYYCLTDYKVVSSQNNGIVHEEIEYDYNKIPLYKTNPQDVIDWHSSVSTEITTPIIALIQSMIDVNPLTRIDIGKVIIDYKAVLISIRKHFIKSNLDNFFVPNTIGPSELVYQSPPPSPKPSPVTRRNRSRSRNNPNTRAK